jgi:putative Mn2+ efflux pump MntP
VGFLIPMRIAAEKGRHMDLPTILLIALGLSMDAVAVALASGCSAGRGKVDARHALLMAFFFGLFQTLMPFAGWMAGLSFKKLITGIDHWLAFILLVAIGGKMIHEARRDADCRVHGGNLRLPVLLGLAVATSIDALAVGLSFSALAVDIALPVLLIGLVTFTLSLLAVFVGNRFGAWLAGRAEILGGLILVAIGLKILLEHLRGG